LWRKRKPTRQKERTVLSGKKKKKDQQESCVHDRTSKVRRWTAGLIFLGIGENSQEAQISSTLLGGEGKLQLEAEGKPRRLIPGEKEPSLGNSISGRAATPTKKSGRKPIWESSDVRHREGRESLVGKIIMGKRGHFASVNENSYYEEIPERTSFLFHLSFEREGGETLLT